MNVRDYGAIGDGAKDDTAAIQRANDVIASAGGGIVFFPPGVYIAAGVKQDSDVEFTGTEQAVLKHPDGVNQKPIVQGRVYTTVGSINKGSRLLLVKTTRGFRPGAIVGIRAAEGASPFQATTLAAAVSSGSTSLLVSQPRDWPSANVNYLVVGNEIVAYRGMSGRQMLNVKRGMFGTTPVAHRPGASVSQAKGLFARVVAVRPNLVELDRAAVKGVSGANVFVGSMNMTVRGLALDGSRIEGGSPTTNPLPLAYDFARWVVIEDSIIRNGDHGAISLDSGTSDSTIANNTLMDHGSLNDTLGSAVWIFRGSSHNEIRDNTIGGKTYKGIMVDDRSEKSTEWDERPVENTVVGNSIDIPRLGLNGAISVIGSEGTRVAGNDVRSAYSGIMVRKSGQGQRPADATASLVVNNRLTRNHTGLYVTGSNNRFAGNVITMATRPIWDAGSGNTYADACMDDPMCSADPGASTFGSLTGASPVYAVLP